MMSGSITVQSNGPGTTRECGERLGRLVQAGDVLLLSGELGAGKTVFVQGLASGLGFEGNVSSKSFVLLGEYRGRLTLYHADLYRLEAPEQVEELALEEISQDGVLAVEWPERAAGLFPPESLEVRFEITSEDRRDIVIEGKGGRGQELMERLKPRPRPDLWP